MSPVVDMTFQGQSMITNQGKDWLTKESLDNLRKIYLKGKDPKNMLASPIYADLKGLTPIMFQAGSMSFF